MLILLIDDNPIDLLVNDKVLRNINPHLEVERKLSGVEAIDYLSKLSSQDQAPAYILLDIKMPIMNGFEFLEEFEALSPSITEGVKVIMVSSSIDPSDRQKAEASRWVYDFWEKPLNVSKIKDCPVLDI